MMADTSMVNSGMRNRSGGGFARIVKKALVVVALLSVPSLMALNVCLGVSVFKLGSEVESLKKEKSALIKSNRAYQIEAASLASPERVESLASSVIGMAVPTDRQVVLVKRVAKGASRPAPATSQATADPRAPGRS